MADLNNWTQLRVSIEVESPLLLGDQRSYGTYTPSRRRVPGSALRGALARSLGPDSTEFRTLFLDGEELLFGDCWPAPDLGTLSVPVPATAHTCKERPGFKPPPGDARRVIPPHGVFDTLVRTLVYDEVLEAQLPLPLIYEPRCPECGNAATTSDVLAMYRGDTDWHRSEVKVRRGSRTAIGRRRSVAEDEMLYTLESICPETIFTGIVRLPATKTDVLLNALPKLTQLGTARSRGMGRVTVEGWRRVVRWSGADADVLQRLERFNDAIQQERDYYGVLTDQPLSDDGWYLPLLLLSDAFLVQAGTPSLTIAATDLGLPASAKVPFVRAWTRGRVIGGWHQAAGLPRRTRLAAPAHSIFVFRVEGLALNDPAVKQALEKLEMFGLGDNRERGMGQIAVCIPFHYEEVG